MKTSTFLIAALAAAALPAAAQNAAGGSGKQIATSGAGNGVAACASCHGASGEGNPASGFPRLAGQSQSYLIHQLNAFAHGERSNPVMAPIAKALSSEQIEAVSAYYAGLNAPKAKPSGTPKASGHGKTLATVGNSAKGVQACANCHGPGGSGEPPTYPYLAGQNSAYLKSSLSAWKSGARNTDPTQQMPAIAKRLSDADITAVAEFYAAQPAPPPLAQETHNMPAGSAARPAAPAGGSGQGGSVPVQGVGSGQGAATGGGSQGPGGGGAASGSGPSGSPTGNAR